MDQETLFTNSKWEILQELSKGEKSPLELAKKTSTSIANISQQLRLLELGELVKSKRIKNREKDKPRQMYSLTKSKAYLIAVSPEFIGKKQIDLTEFHTVLIRILFIPDTKIHYHIQKFFIELEPYFNKLELIAVRNEHSQIKCMIYSKDQALKAKIKDKKITNPDGQTMNVSVEFLTDKELKNLDHNKIAGFYAIHDKIQLFDNGDARED